jgi:hypothetical protein
MTVGLCMPMESLLNVSAKGDFAGKVGWESNRRFETRYATRATTEGDDRPTVMVTYYTYNEILSALVKSRTVRNP